MKLEMDENLLLSSFKFIQQKEYWTQRLSGTVRTELLWKNRSGDGQPETASKREVDVVLPPELNGKLLKLSKQSNLSIYFILLTVLKSLIFKYTGNNDITVISPVYQPKVADDTINRFLFLRDELDASLSFKELLIKVRKGALEAFENQDYPHGALIEYLSNTRHIADRGLLSDIVCFMDNIHVPGVPEEHDGPLVFSFSRESGVTGRIIFDAQIYEPFYIEQIAVHFTRLLEQSLQDVNDTIGNHSMLSGPERDQLLVEFNRTETAVEFPTGKTVVDVFEEHALKHPDRTAVVFAEDDAMDKCTRNFFLTYGTLDAMANRLAGVLKRDGIARDTVVGLMVERSGDMAAAILGILKAGGAYMPIDPEYPSGRRRYMISDSKAGILLTQKRLDPEAGELLEANPGLKILYLDHMLTGDTGQPGTGEIKHTGEPVSPGDLAYIIYTSGTTGRPKGVMIEHGNVVNLAMGLNERIYRNCRPSSKVCLISPYVFDASVKQIFGALLLGHQLYIVPEETRIDGIGLLRFYQKHKIDVSDGTPTHLKLLSEVTGDSFPGFNVKRFLIGGEALPRKVVDRFFERFASGKEAGFPKIINVYGPTECCVDTTSHEVVPSTACGYETIPLGRPMPHYRVLILDKNRSLLPVGVAGELCISGRGVGRGYWNNHSLTGEKFIDNPWTPGEKMYRTGDLARWLPDGTLLFTGRIDNQVKVRGFRIELEEIENQLLNHNDVNEARVLAREKGDETYLCAYIVAGKTLDTHDLRDFLSRELPDYLIPPHFVQLEKMPLTPNGKIDRNALPEPEIIDAGEYVAPRDRIETKLVDIWSEILELPAEKISVETSFFELGGHSLKATVLAAQIHKAFNTRIPLVNIFRIPRVRDLAEYIREETVSEKYASIAPTEKKEYYAIAPAQHRMYVLQQRDRISTVYNMPLFLDIERDYDRHGLEETFVKLIDRHEAFRTSFIMTGGQIVQKVVDHVDFSIVDFNDTALGLTGTGNADDFVKPFDLSEAPLLRVGLAVFPGDRHMLLLDMHHIISDGVSHNILIEEFEALSRGDSLPALRLQYKDFSQWLTGKDLRETLSIQEGYWMNQLHGEVPVLSLPTDFTRPATLDFEGDSIIFSVNPRETEVLEKLALEANGSLFMVLLAIFNVMLAKVSGQADIVVGTVVAGRWHADLQRIVGMFVNTLALRNSPAGNKTFRDFMKKVIENTINAFENQEYPFDNLVEKIGVHQEENRNPIFDVMFVFQNQVDAASEANNAAEEEHIVSSPRTAKFDLLLIGSQVEQGIRMRLEYRTGLFKPETAERFAGYFNNIVSIIANEPDKNIGLIDMLPKEEKQWMLYDFNRTDTELPGEPVIHEMIRKQTSGQPGKIAIKTGTRTLTYDRLERKTTLLALRLREKGFLPGMLAGLIGEPSENILIGILGILKAGGAYVPMDPSYPQNRVSYILDDCQCPLLLTAGPIDSLEGLSNRVEVINLDETALDDEGEYCIDSVNKPGDPAYVIYTSGSTGRPKGVIVEHRSVVNYICWAADTYVKEKDEPVDFPFYSSISFDLTVTSIFTPLFTGNAVVVYSGGAKETMIQRIVRDDKVGVVKLTPSHLELIREMPIKKSNIKRFIVGGEAFAMSLAHAVSGLFPGDVELLNEYGPTEATVGCMIYRYNPVSDQRETVPIGVGSANVKIYLLDGNLLPVMKGALGEMYVADGCLARGYVNNPALTREKFVENPFVPGTRMYRTGDLGRWLPDGNIEYAGRIDQQVKIRGFRVELGEIETKLKNVTLPPSNGFKKTNRIEPGETDNIVHCSRCLLPSNYPGIRFDEDGVCHVCREFETYKDDVTKYFKEEKDFPAVVDQARAAKKSEYDCLLLFSGGKDSTYVLYKLVDMGLKVLTFTFDNGFISDAAFRNIKRTTTLLGVDHITYRADDVKMNEVLVESLRMDHSVCTGCWNVLNTVGARHAFDKGIPLVISGLSRGQIFDMRLEGLFQMGVFSEREIEKKLKLFRKTFHSNENRYSRLLDVELGDDAIESIAFVDFFRYFDSDSEGILEYLEAKGWIKPSDTGFCSSNCLINDVGIYIHRKESGYHFYAAPLSWDCRLENISREEGMRKLEFKPDKREINRILSDIGYYRPISIKDAVVTVHSSHAKIGGDRYLCAYFVADGKVEADDLKTHLAGDLPGYFIPTFFIQLDKIPLTVNGKVNYRALPVPEISGADEYVAPSNDVQLKIVRIWAELLGVEQENLGVNANFFDIGGQSLKATILVARVHKEFDVVIPLEEIFKSPTIAGQAAYVMKKLAGARRAEEKYFSIEPSEKREYYPLSSAQERLYVLQQMDDRGVGYNMPNIVWIEQEIDPAKLEHNFVTLVKRHESLRTAFIMVGHTPVQRVYDADDIGFNVSYKEMSEADAALEVENFVTPFDLSQAPLVKVSIIKTGETRYLLMVDMHHIISDGISQGIFVKEFFALDAGEELPTPGIQYKDYALWQNRRGMDTPTELDRQKEFWLTDFSGDVPVLNLPTDYPRPLIQTFEGDIGTFVIDERETALLKKLAGRAGATMFMTGLALYSVLILKLSAQEDVVIGTPVAGRRHTDLEKVIGMFVNTLPLRLFPREDKTFPEFLENVKERTLAAYKNQDYQFEDLVEQLALKRDAGRNPLFDIIFTWEDTGTPGETKSRLNLSSYSYKRNISKFDLTLNGTEINGQFYFTFEYSTRLFKKETVDRFSDYFKTIVSSVLMSPESLIGDIELIGEEEKQRVSVEFNDSSSVYPSEQSIPGLFAQQVEKNPDGIAVMFDDLYCTYRELDDRSSGLARLLPERGVTPDTLVGVMLDPSIEVAIALLGILKAGGAYLPIDSSAPATRIDSLVRDSNLSILLSKTGTIESLPFIPAAFKDSRHVPAAGELVMFDANEGKPAAAAGAGDSPAHTVHPRNLAYAIYTSGSTGGPKGVLVEHQNVVRLVKNTNYVDFIPGDRLLQTGSLAFDASTFEIWGALLNGLTLCFEKKENILIPDQLQHTIGKYDIGTLWLTSPLFNQISHANPRAFHGVKNLLVGGDVLSPVHINRVRSLFPALKVINGYGPTENTTFSTTYPIEGGHSENIPIGRPIANSTAFILDRRNRLQPIGIPGELYVGGDGVSRGYLNDPRLTAEKFVHIAPGEETVRLYRTGDLARWLPGGDIQFLGRMDRQLKIRGFRIEVGEIESWLLKQSLVKEVVVVDRKDHDGDTRLYAYIVPGDGLDIDELRQTMSLHFPAYMVPAYFISIDRIPLTPNGKVNRKELPEPVDTMEKTPRVPGRLDDPVEEEMARIWSDVLGIEQNAILPQHDFFELGGHSLKATMLVSRIARVFKVKVPLTDIFVNPSLSGLSLFVKNAAQFKFTPIEAGEAKEYYPMSPAQKRLYVLYQVDQASLTYNVPSFIRVEGPLETGRLEKAARLLVKRHHSLSTSFEMLEDEPVQRIHKDTSFAVQYHDLTEGNHGSDENSEPVETIIAGFVRPFDLTRPPLMRIGVIRTASERFILMADLHHIVADGVSMGLFVRELSLLYEEISLPSLRVQYCDFSQWQNHRLTTGDIKSQEEFWLRQFEGNIPALNLPYDFARPEIQGFEGRVHHFDIPENVSQRIKELATQTNTTLFMSMLSVFYILLAKYTGQDDIVIGSSISGRNHDDLQGIIGMFVNMLSLRNRPLPSSSFHHFLIEVKDNVLGAFDNQEYQFDELVMKLGLHGSTDKNPLFNVVFTLQNMEKTQLEKMPGRDDARLKFLPFEFKNRISKFDLLLVAIESKDQILMNLEYSTELFQPGTIEQMAGYYIEIWEQILENPGILIKDITISHQFLEVDTSTILGEDDEFSF